MTRRLRHALPLALILLSLALRVYRLGDKNIWWDEGLAIWAVRKSFVEATLWTAGDVHPPLFFWLLWGWVRLLGQTELGARLMTAMIGVLIAAVAYALGRRLAGPLAGVLALLLVAVARFEVWWSMELRMYALAGLAVALAVYAGARWLAGVTRAPPSEGRWLWAYVGAATAALYTVYLTGVAVLAINVGVIVVLLAGAAGATDRARSARRVREWLVAQGVVVLLMVPWLWLALPRMQSWTSIRGEPASLRFVAELWATLAATGVSTGLSDVRGWTILFWLSVLVAPALLLVLHRYRQGGASRRLFQTLGRPSGGWAITLVLLAVLPPVAVWAATQPRSIFYSPAVEARYFLPFAAPVYVLAAWLIRATGRVSRPLGLACAVGALLPMLVALPGHYEARRLQDLYQTMVLAVWSQAEPGDAVVLLSGNRYPIFRYYYDQPWVQPAGAPEFELPADAPPDGAARPPVIPFPDRGTETIDALEWQARLEEILATHDRIWLAEVESHLQDPDGQVEEWLNARLPRVLSEGYGPDALHLYDADDEAPSVTGLTRRFPGTATAEVGVSLQPLVGLPARAAGPGDTPHLTLYTTDGTAGDSAVDGLHLELMPERSVQTFSRDLRPMLGGLAGGRVRVPIPVTKRTPAGRQSLTLAGDEGQRIGPLTVRGTLPGVDDTEPVDADFGFVRLAEVGIAPVAPRSGEAFAVDLHFVWAEPGDDPAHAVPRGIVPDPAPVVFVHLVGPPRSDTGDPVWAGQDGEPSSGAWDTRAGGGIFDRHVLVVDPEAPPGTYQVVAGLYDAATGERYPVAGANADPEARSVTVGTVNVR